MSARWSGAPSRGSSLHCDDHMPSASMRAFFTKGASASSRSSNACNYRFCPDTRWRGQRGSGQKPGTAAESGCRPALVIHSPRTLRGMDHIAVADPVQ